MFKRKNKLLPLALNPHGKLKQKILHIASVVEAEIAQPGSTGVRVILNENGHVITVIPGG